ncbi:MAG: peptide chain release factor 3, partial [Chitinispirillaceae bacterium]|nr:peptide chain release factor 3 [Chitinispirillaceae bacterium]
SHPDAGKTTLTEKLLLYGGAVHLAGSVTARKKERSTVSDWLEIERKRGISVSSTVLHFEYDGYHINLLDTPGHNDFSEDTYRVLMAVDSVIMVIDGGKGIELQTKKLFEVCRKRSIPVFTFVNKMDRPALDTLSILDEIERVLHIAAYPMNWPLGSGVEFRGVWDRRTRLAHLFERTAGGAFRAPVSTCGLDDPLIRERLSETVFSTTCEEVAMVEHAGVPFDPADVAKGATTPVFFGSAVNNFGVQLLLDGFLGFSPPPQPRITGGREVRPDSPFFSGFIFKIQANMDPRHRDRMAFVRIVSGKFSRDMQVTHVRTGKKVRLSNSSNVFGRDRVSIDEAYPGDVIGIVGGDFYAIGDTLSEDPNIAYSEIPRFPPECFAYIYNPTPSNYKRFQNGVDQLVQEGLVHLFEVSRAGQKTLVLAAVGPLQFDLVHYRLESEYSVVSKIEKAPWTLARWIVSGFSAEEDLRLPFDTALAKDREGREVLLFQGEWHLNYFSENNKHLTLADAAA